jgi:lysine-N-methylase
MSEQPLQPHYAEKFRCTGAACQANCCQGWNVYVDKATYKKYRATPGLRQATAQHIELNPTSRDTFTYALLKFGADKRCPFLAEDQLCNVQKQYGAEFLSTVCGLYPRALVRFEGSMQRALYLSCPEAARLVLLNPQLLPAPGGPRFAEFRLEAPQKNTLPSLPELSVQVRSFALDLLQERSYPLWQRLLLLTIVCRRIEESGDTAKAVRTPQLLAQYATMIREGSLRSYVDGIPPRPEPQLDLVLRLIKIRYQCEPPEDSFATCVGNFLNAIGYSPQAPLAEAAARYQQACLCCYQPFAETVPGFMENYLLNHVFRSGFPFVQSQGLHSTAPLTGSLLLALHYRLLHSLLIGTAAGRGNAFCTADALQVVHAFARAVEHNVEFGAALVRFAQASELQQTDGLAVLLRN